MRRALVSLPDGAWDVIDSLRPQLGNADSEIVRNIVLAYFIEKGYLLKNTDQETLLKAIEEVFFGRLYLDSQIHHSVVNELTFGRNRRRAGVQLTKREKEILKLIVEEHSNQQIAGKLEISLRTVETHRFNLTQKLSVKNTAGLVKEAMRLGLV